jgi:hypothetical protein
MCTTNPTTGAADAVFEFGDNSLHMIGTSFCLFRKSNPTNPLVAGEGSEALPSDKSFIVGQECRFKIGCEFMGGAA